ncbi:amino acid deaminase [Herbaspirillum sp. YR522]|uniref:amino acid deaminase n=1 Tax=Herbaspirillum sp. YR522 TaxID=1144342 RepID=UPI00026F6596|nr:amino acid deaminase [Herbaspirillum sp. YR522]EJM97307.1 putative amino acid aldolase or racemase [Herbaspirillum sp. YR522]
MNDTNYQIAYQTGIIDPVNKGLGRLPGALAPDQASTLKWNLLNEDISLPAAVLYDQKLQHNLAWMQEFVGRYQVKLAPHGKTTMAPKLFKRQLDTGAWGITLATAHQTLAGYQHGVRRVIMANQLVGKRNMAIISDLLADPDFEFFCLVDSADLVDQLGRFFGERGQTLDVLLELGPVGGRTGVRDAAQQAAVIEAIKRWDSIALAGVEVYEGVLKEEAEIRQFLQRAVACATALAQQGLLAKRIARGPAVLTGAGSAWYDVVAEEFARADIGVPLDVVLRPGCYLTHDVGIYRAAQSQIQVRNPVAHQMRSQLQPALQLWAYVQSIPEPDKAIIALGKRDAAFDAGLPLPVSRFRPGVDSAPAPTPAHWEVTGMMDQHAYLRINAGDDIRVGDMLAFDISHPCLTFDKWRHLPVLDPQFDVVDVVQTFF